LKNKAVRDGDLELFDKAQLLNEEECAEILRTFQQKLYQHDSEDEDLSGLSHDMKMSLRAHFDDAETLEFWRNVKDKEEKKGARSGRDAKAAKIEAQRADYKDSQTQEMDPQETILRLKADFARRYHCLKAASGVMLKETVTLVRDESRRFIKDTTNFVVQIVQREMLVLLRQMDKHKQLMK